MTHIPRHRWRSGGHAPRVACALLCLALCACGPRHEEAFVPDPGLVGRPVQSTMGPLPLLAEPGGIRLGTLPAGLSVKAVARQTDEAGRGWIRVEQDSLHGWLPQDLLQAATGQEGHIETH